MKDSRIFSHQGRILKAFERTRRTLFWSREIWWDIKNTYMICAKKLDLKKKQSTHLFAGECLSMTSCPSNIIYDPRINSPSYAMWPATKGCA